MDAKTNDRDLKAKKAAIERKYKIRITIAKEGRKFFLEKDYVKAAQKYHEYLEILAYYKSLSSIFDLRPSHFDKNDEITEMLLISNIFWELACIYELTPKLQDSFQKCLNQFVTFTVNQKFQVLNSEMLRKYIKSNKKKIKNISKMQEAYGKIQSESKACYIATLCFGNSHPVTMNIRSLKPFLLKFILGQKFVRIYYVFSTKLLYSKRFKPFEKSFSFISRPPLILLSFIIELTKKRNL